MNREIPRDQWKTFLDGFTRAHHGWLSNVTVMEDGARGRPEAHELPLEAVNADLKHGDDNSIEIILGTDKDHFVTHSIAKVKLLVLRQTEEGIDRGLTIEGADGTATLEFRTPAGTESLNGMKGAADAGHRSS